MADEDLGIESGDNNGVEPPKPTPSSLTNASSTTASESPQRYNQQQRCFKDSHACKQEERRAEHSQELHGLKSVTLKHRQGLEGLHSAANLEHLNVALSGWVGGKRPSDTSTYTLEEVTNEPYNLRHIQWDGR